MPVSAMSALVNIYCDESCHLANDGIPTMVLGGILCQADSTAALACEIRALKARHRLPPNFEAKWGKVSPAKLDFYSDLIRLFLLDDRLQLRCVVIPDKTLLDHSQFSDSHDEWYYKMYYVMLKQVINRSNGYRVYIDIKDTVGGRRVEALHNVLSRSFSDSSGQIIQRVQQVRSHEVELLQVADLLIGAVGYANRGLDTSSAKLALVNQLAEGSGVSITSTSPLSAEKINLLIWKAQAA